MLGGDSFVQPLAAASIIGHQTWIEPEQKWRLLDWQLLDEFGLAPNCGYLADLGMAATHRRQGIASELVCLGWRVDFAIMCLLPVELIRSISRFWSEGI
jgi:hypothetical protein